MRIKFIPPDPRAGLIAEMEQGVAQRFIDQGLATTDLVEKAATPSDAPAEAAAEEKPERRRAKR
jgi:hypothetical protein